MGILLLCTDERRRRVAAEIFVKLLFRIKYNLTREHVVTDAERLVAPETTAESEACLADALEG